MVRPIGIEPTHLAPEASALSTELRAPNHFLLLSSNKNYNLLGIKCQTTPQGKFI